MKMRFFLKLSLIVFVFNISLVFPMYRMMPLNSNLLNNMLINAVEDLNLKKIKIALKKGSDINYQDAFDFTPLMIASNRNSTEIVKFLIKSGANVNHTNYVGDSALNLAARCFSVSKEARECIKILTFSGSNLDLIKNNQEVYNFAKKKLSKIFLAIKNHNLPKIQTALNDGMLLSIKDDNGLSLLHHAVIAKDIDIIIFLLNLDVSLILVKDFNNRNPIHLAIAYGHFNLLKKFLNLAYAK